EVQRLTTKARDNKLEKSDLEGGTFTISNHGVSGSLIATPIIINQPQSAILGIGKLENRVKWSSETQSMLAIPCCYVTLTIDHRALDGYQANQYMMAFVEFLENYD
ncbi:MAG: 2-oxo acid dehydrogenase subunit E2, partial [Bdellovibrionales bacterium]|nr:2-oxo acid dehydrogenase subunit E2 [Bdellovibrionales bacterium]